MQIGGIGYVAGDEGGGAYLARAAVRTAFDECFRFGPQSLITKMFSKCMELMIRRILAMQ